MHSGIKIRHREPELGDLAITCGGRKQMNFNVPTLSLSQIKMRTLTSRNRRIHAPETKS
jgi:hypothetical protein